MSEPSGRRDRKTEWILPNRLEPTGYEKVDRGRYYISRILVERLTSSLPMNAAVIVGIQRAPDAWGGLLAHKWRCDRDTC